MSQNHVEKYFYALSATNVLKDSKSHFVTSLFAIFINHIFDIMTEKVTRHLFEGSLKHSLLNKDIKKTTEILTKKI